MPSILKKIAGWLGWASLAFILLISSFVVWGSGHGWHFNAVLSGSMEPLLHVGGLVVMEPVDTAILKIGDIISFQLRSTDTPICHRIIDIVYQGRQEYFRTKGDANKSADSTLVPAVDVSGKKLVHIPVVGRLLDIKKAGSTPVPLFGNTVPLAVLLVTILGLLIVGVTLNDIVMSVYQPGRQWRKQAFKKRREMYARRRAAFQK